MVRFILLILLGHAVLTNSYTRSSGSHHIVQIHRGHQQSHFRLSVVEHLVDCAENPAIAELYGALANDFCLQKADSPSIIFRGLGGLVEQAATIGFLVMSYFFFKRTANGISEWENDDDEDFDGDNNGDGDLSEELRRCPQCNGRGKFEFDGGADNAPICDLCGGSGSIVRSIRARTLGLPISSRKLWSDDDDSISDRM